MSRLCLLLLAPSSLAHRAAPKTTLNSIFSQAANNLTSSSQIVKVDSIDDYQPISVVLGAALESTLKSHLRGLAAMTTVEIREEALQARYRCPTVVLPSTLTVEAPKGSCGGLASHFGGASGKVANSSGIMTDVRPLVDWSEQCFSFFAAEGSLKNGRTQETIAKWRTKMGMGTRGNEIELQDCNGRAVYTVHENVYNLAGKNFEECDGGVLY